MVRVWKRFNTRERIAVVFYALAIVAVVLQVVLLSTGTLKSAFPTMLIVPVLLIVAGAFNLSATTLGQQARRKTTQTGGKARRSMLVVHVGRPELVGLRNR
jgi:hypothetical protein